jgi:hypothetical protein
MNIRIDIGDYVMYAVSSTNTDNRPLIVLELVSLLENHNIQLQDDLEKFLNERTEYQLLYIF